MESSFKLYILLVTFILLLCSGCIEGKITISPLGIAPVCLGDQLELTCTTTERFLEWRLTIVEINYEQLISVTTSIPINLNLSHTSFIFSKSSIQNSLPLISALLINPASNVLNGSVVNCVERATGISSSTVILKVINQHTQDSQVIISLLSEQFENDNVLVTLEWIRHDFYSYNITTVPQLKYDADYELARVYLNLSYNTFYNMNVIASSPCGQNSMNDFIGLHYFSCRNPASQTNPSIEVIDLRNPAILGSNVTFSCPPGLKLIGQTSSVCMENGEWEPDPMSVDCKAIPMPTESGPLNQQNNIMIIIVSTTVCVLCSMIFFTIGLLCYHYCAKRKQCIVRNEATPIQENEVNTDDQEVQQNFDFQDNVAYASVQM